MNWMCKHFGHNGKHIFDEKKTPPNLSSINGSGYGVVDFIKSMTKHEKTYVKTVCTRCGIIIDQR